MRLRVLPALLPVTVLLTLAGGPAGAQQPGRAYVGPTLRRLLAPATRQRVAPAGRFDMIPVDAALPMQGRLALDRDGRGRPRVGTFLELSDAGALAVLRARGVQLGTVVRRPDGHILATARVPLDVADSVSRLPGLRSMFAAPLIKLDNDSGVRAIHADSVRERLGSAWGGSAGQGVIVGIYDTGLDFTHPDFLDGAGNTRVLAAWDQTRSGTSPGMGFTYGTYCTQAMIQNTVAGLAGGCPLVDSNGHGSHVAGTAAGNGGAAGSGTQYQYAGVAPAADLVIVKGGNGSFAYDQIVDGITFIDSMAVRRHEPAAVNLSLGGQGGPHDGTSLPEQMIDALARPGFAVVVAAGNDGSNGSSITSFPAFLFHAVRPVATGDQQSVSITIPTYTPHSGTCQNEEDIELWYGGTDQVDVSVVRPGGAVVTASTGQSVNDDATSGYVQIDNASTGPDPGNQDNNAFIALSDCGPSDAAPAAGTWQIRLTGRAMVSGKAVHIWLDGGDLGGQEAEGADGFDNRYIVGTPGTAKSVITVAAFTTKQSWISTDGKSHYYTDRAAIGDLANFSSGGPTRDERQKPDIAAPGATVVSSLSKNATPGSTLMVAEDGRHWALEGTSMATPHVTGSVALMFQARPDLTAAQLKAAFNASAGHDAFTAKTYGGGSPQNWWGGGKLDIRAALAGLNLDPAAVASVTLALRADTIPRNGTDRIAVAVHNALGIRLDSAVTWASSNLSVATVDATGLIRTVGYGNAWVSASAGGRRDSARIVVVQPSLLTVTGRAIAPAGAASSKRGTVLPLLGVDLTSKGFEAMRVTGLAFDVRGVDPGAALLLYRDIDHNSAIGPTEPQLASKTVALSSATQPQRVTFTLDSLTVGANATASLIVALSMSGEAQNASVFSVALARDGTHTLGLRSQAADQIDSTGASVAAADSTATTVLDVGEVFALSENPVQHGHVIFNFSERPKVAAVYTLSGRRVANLLAGMTAGDMPNGGRVDWQLVNDDGKPVANGIYLVVFDVGGQMIRRKIFIARPQE